MQFVLFNTIMNENEKNYGEDFINRNVPKEFETRSIFPDEVYVNGKLEKNNDQIGFDLSSLYDRFEFLSTLNPKYTNNAGEVDLSNDESVGQSATVPSIYTDFSKASPLIVDYAKNIYNNSNYNDDFKASMCYSIMNLVERVFINNIKFYLNDILSKFISKINNDFQQFIGDQKVVNLIDGNEFFSNIGGWSNGRYFDSIVKLYRPETYTIKDTEMSYTFDYLIKEIKSAEFISEIQVILDKNLITKLIEISYEGNVRISISNGKYAEMSINQARNLFISFIYPHMIYLREEYINTMIKARVEANITYSQLYCEADITRHNIESKEDCNYYIKDYDEEIENMKKYYNPNQISSQSNQSINMIEDNFGRKIN